MAFLDLTYAYTLHDRHIVRVDSMSVLEFVKLMCIEKFVRFV